MNDINKELLAEVQKREKAIVKAAVVLIRAKRRHAEVYAMEKPDGPAPTRHLLVRLEKDLTEAVEKYEELLKP